MLPKSVKTISDVINYYYALLVIAEAAGMKKEYGFINYTYNRLKNGQMQMANRDGEIRVQMRTDPVCVYCGGPSDSRDHVIPRNYDGPEGQQNVVRSCKHCNSSKGDHDLVDWWVNIKGNDESTLPRIPAGIYLKYSMDWHRVHDSLENPARSLLDLKPFAHIKGR